MTHSYQEAKTFLSNYGQEQVLRFYNTLSLAEQQNLLNQIFSLNLDRFSKYLESNLSKKRGHFEPVSAVTISEIATNKERYKKIGLKTIQAGKVGLVLLAGGQGSRLGYNGPKGTFNIGIDRELYIFECLINNLMEVVDEAESYIHLFIMTSESNDTPTREFLEEHNYFGYPKEYITFFIQDMEPAVDEQYHLVLDRKDHILTVPNGNGGWFQSMQSNGLLPKLHQYGIEWINVFAVDNVLQRMADPCFIGATILSNYSSGAKVVSKADPNERVGVLCKEDGKISIVEYIEMTDEMIHRREPDGTLSYRFGVILNYLFRLDKLEEISNSILPVYSAHKKLKYLDEEGNLIVPDTPNGYKYETLVLDMVRLQDDCLAYEVDRTKEFAPIKNAVGVDSVKTAQILLQKNGIAI